MKIHKFLFFILLFNSTMIFSLQNSKEENEKFIRAHQNLYNIETLPTIDDNFIENCTFDELKKFIEKNPANKNAVSVIGNPLIISLILAQRTSLRTDNDLYEMIKYLISKKVDLDFQNPYEETTLITAVYFCSLEVVKLLVEAGADIDLKNEFSQTAYDIAHGHLVNPKMQSIANYLFNAWLRKNKIFIAEKLNEANDTTKLQKELLSIVQDYLFEGKPKITHNNRKSKKRKANEMEESFFKVKKI